jgi:hypothetical protein
MDEGRSLGAGGPLCRSPSHGLGQQEEDVHGREDRHGQRYAQPGRLWRPKLDPLSYRRARAPMLPGRHGLADPSRSKRHAASGQRLGGRLSLRRSFDRWQLPR